MTVSLEIKKEFLTDFQKKIIIARKLLFAANHKWASKLLNNLNISKQDALVLEVGCGSGINLLELIMLGFNPANLTGNELLKERVAAAKHKLPDQVNIISGDALEIRGMENKFDIVYQSTVFTSILDKEFQVKLANAMWKMVKPGGGVLWYDFIYNNPNNPDVQGVSIKRVKELFPDSKIIFTRTTLAPPISRRVTRIHPSLYTIFNFFPFLRTHVLCWISKPE